MIMNATRAAGFWMRMGYVIVGVTPHAEGAGLPTIDLAKRVCVR
jgi:hypothetical protein